MGVSVIGGQLDLDGDGDIDVNDSGTVWGLVGSDTVNSEITVINGGLDVDGTTTSTVTTTVRSTGLRWLTGCSVRCPAVCFRSR